MDVNENINFKKVENEFYNAKAADEKYSRENEAKFRAVHQKVSSYEEFKDIVAASGLTPLERRDIYNSDKVRQPWNTAYLSNIDNDTATHKPIAASTPAYGQIKSCDEFYKVWKGCKTDDSKMNFLLAVSKNAIDIFKCDIPFNVFEESLHLFKDKITTENCEGFVLLLKAFSKSQRFGLALKFLSKGDISDLKQLFSQIRDAGFNVTDLQTVFLI